MQYLDSFAVTTTSDCEICVSRNFAAPRSLMLDPFIRPELITHWLLEPPGWTIPVCETDVRMGGVDRCEWRNPVDENELAVSGVYVEVVASERLVATEPFDEAWYPCSARNTNLFQAEDGTTKVTISLYYASKEARDTVRPSAVERGITAGHERPDESLPSLLLKDVR